MSISTVKCPNCAKQVPWNQDNPYRPFCCERCKLIDFGAWAKEEHSIAGDPDIDDLFSNELNE